MALKGAVENWKKTCTLQRFFRTAVCQNDVTTVKGLMMHQRDGLDVDAWNEDGLCPIHQCCIHGNKRLVSVLLKAGANINAADPKGWTSLHTAAAMGNYDLTKYLIRNGADVMEETINGELAIDLSLNSSIARLLGAAMHNQGYTAQANYYLNKLESRKNCEKVSRQARLTLQQKQYIEAKDLLLCPASVGEDLELCPTSRAMSRTSLRKDSVSLYPARTRRKSKSYKNALTLTMPGDTITFYPTSILKKCDSYDSSSSGQSSPSSSSSGSLSSWSSSSDECDSDDSIQETQPTILRKQHSVQFDTEVLFMNYVQENEYTKLAMLLENIDDISIINTLDRKGLSAVHWAAIKGYPECLRVLASFGAIIDIRDPFGWTALHAAVVTSNIGCVERLLELQADLFALTKDGESVFDWSTGEEILDILREHMRGHMDDKEVRCTSI